VIDLKRLLLRLLYNLGLSHWEAKVLVISDEKTNERHFHKRAGTDPGKRARNEGPSRK
jgi:hypothetical protein